MRFCLVVGIIMSSLYNSVASRGRGISTRVKGGRRRYTL